jgi:hypothetical protein
MSVAKSMTMRKLALSVCALAITGALIPARADTVVAGSVAVAAPVGPSPARRAYLFSDKLDGVLGDVIAITPSTDPRAFVLRGLSGATGVEDLDIYFYRSLDGTGDPCERNISGAAPLGGETGTMCADARWAVVVLFQGAGATFDLTY